MMQNDTRPKRHKRGEVREILATMSDEELMRQFQDGALGAFDIIFERLKGYLDYYLYKGGVTDPTKREDMLQETFMRAYRNRHSYRPEAKLRTWLLTIARNYAHSQYKAEQRRGRRISITVNNSKGEEYPLYLPAPDRSPLDNAESEESRRLIRRALDLVPADFREAVVLRDMQQLSYAEIRKITGLPLGTVKSRIHRGRWQVYKNIKKFYDEFS